MSTHLLLRDPATGLRRGPIRYPDGNPPAPGGCRWCGAAPSQHYGQTWAASAGWHTWEQPTAAQTLARMRARRAARARDRHRAAVAFVRAAGLVGPSEARRIRRGVTR